MSDIERRIVGYLDAAEAQGYRVRSTSKGHYVVTAPEGKNVQPGYRAITVSVPRHNNGQGDDIAKRDLKRAGVKFPDDSPKKQVEVVPVMTLSKNAPPAVTVAAPGADLFTEASHKINSAIAALSELESILKKIQAEGKELTQLRDLLNKFTAPR